MANLYDTECQEVMDTSDGDDHQLLGDVSHQLLRTEVVNDYSANTALFRRLMQINDARKPSRSTSDHSDVESLVELEFRPTQKYGVRSKREKMIETDMSQKPMMVDLQYLLSLANTKMNSNGEASNSLVCRMVKNGKKFNKDITDTLRISDAYVDDKKRAL